MLQGAIEPTRSRALDGLRGFAAVAVIYYHAILHPDVTLIDRVLYAPIQAAGSVRDAASKIGLTVLNGESAVFLFFVLSGCVLHLSLGRLGHLTPLPLAASFTVARLVRLYPPLAACLLAFVAVSVLWGWAGATGFPRFGIAAFFKNVLLYKIAMHGPSTTIQAEVLAIPFLLCGYFMRRAFGVPGLMCCLVYALYAIEAGWAVFWLPNMHAYLFAFIAGMLVAETGFRSVLALAHPLSGWLALACFVGGRAFYYHVSIAALIAMVAAATLLVGILYHNPQDRLRQLLERPLAQFLGRISYSLYLLNVIVLCAIWAVTDQMAWPTRHALETGLLVGTAALLVTIPLAIASERWIEQPSIRVGRWLARKIRARLTRGTEPVRSLNPAGTA